MIIETEQLILKQYELSYAEEIYKVVSQREVADTMMMIPHPYPKEAVSKWIDYLIASFQQGAAYEFAIFKKCTNRYIGNAGFVSISKVHRHAEIGYFLDSNEWGNGYATEVCEALLDYGFNQLRLMRINARCMSRNIASKRVLEKIGMQLEGTFKKEFIKNNKWEDIHYYAVLREEYFHQINRVFGEKEENVAYKTRPSVYGVVLNKDNKIAIVHVENKIYFLPGGGLEVNETEEQCLHRELLEEAGMEVTIKEPIGYAYLYNFSYKDGQAYLHESYFYQCTYENIVSDSVEDDHQLVWMDIEEAITKLFVEHQKWAVRQLIKEK